MNKLAALLALAPLVACALPAGDAGDAVDAQGAAVATGLGNRVQIKSMINTAAGGKCIDVASSIDAVGTPIVQYTCHKGLNQQFYLQMVTLGGQYQIVWKQDQTKCLGIPGPYADDHQLLRLAACTDPSGYRPVETRWYLDGSDLAQPVSHVSIRSALGSHSASGSGCVDVGSGAATNSLWMQVYNCHGGANQKWELSNW